MDEPTRSVGFAFCSELLQYEIPHSTMILNIPKYNGMTDLDEDIDTYKWTMTLLRMDKRFIRTYFPVMLAGKEDKWFKALCPGSIISFSPLRYLFLNNFMQLQKGRGDTNSIMECKQKEGESIREYYARFTLATLSMLGHEQFLVIGAFAQGLLSSHLSKKMQGIVPKTRDKLKYRVERYLRQFDGEEQKEENIKAVAKAYIKQEEVDTHSSSHHQ